MPEGEHLVEIGKANIMREGADVTLIGWSIMAIKALEAAKLLEAEGISAEVIDLRTLRPLDEETILASVRKTHRCVVVGEEWLQGSLQSHIAALITDKAFDDLDAPVATLGAVDSPLPYAKNLEALCLPQAADIVAAAKRVMYKE